MSIAKHLLEHAALGVGRSVPPFGLFVKPSPGEPVFHKINANSLYVRAGTKIEVAGKVLEFNFSRPVLGLGALVPGGDYDIYACADGNLRAVPAFELPADFDESSSRLVGGFHYGLVSAETTVGSGLFATAGTGMVWAQYDVDKIAGINAFSIWDLKYRPICKNPRGMARSIGGTWFDIYLCNTNVDANGTSRYNQPVASGTVLPKVPVMFGGSGGSYSGLTWWVANELARAVGKRLPWEHEFNDAAFGVTENASLGGASETIPATGRAAGFTSRIGLEQATGHHLIWGLDSGYRHDGTATWAWRNNAGGRGQVYLYTETANVRVALGGHRNDGSRSGSRCAYWNDTPWYSHWAFGLRAACDHLELD